jgi:hypothetical protein
MHSRHLDDEHMRLYEWCGAGTGMNHPLPSKSKRSHPWHASYSVLSLLTTLLILGGCDSKGPAERAGEQVDQAVQDVKDTAANLYDDAVTEAAPAQEAGRRLDEAREETADKLGRVGESLQKP